MRYILLLLPLYWLGCANEPTASTVTEYPAVSWRLVQNQLKDGTGFRAAFTVHNTTSDTLRDEWKLYYNQTHRLPVPPGPGATAYVEHMSGEWYRVVPMKTFRLAPGDSTRITYESYACLINRSDMPVGPYWVFGEADDKPVPVTDFTASPIGLDQLPCSKNHNFPPPGAATNFARNAALQPLEEGAYPRLVPSPRSVQRADGYFNLNAQTTVEYTTEAARETFNLLHELKQTLKANLSTREGIASGANSIQLRIDPLLQKATPEAYRLDINGTRVQLTGSDAAGLYYGIQTLLALDDGSHQLPQGIIEDAPRFPYRGFMLDVARNFYPKKEVLAILDLMGRYKLNKFHFHLTNDEAWRLEIPGLPELTRVGSRRGHPENPEAPEYLPPAYGSGPFSGKSRGSGHYSTTDYREILQYAAERHIEVIPEISMPGHIRAGIAAMEVRERGSTVDSKPVSYRLDEPADRSEYRSVQLHPDNVVNVCQESTYSFIEKVVDEVLQMHQKAEVPLRVLHTGGDEVPGGVWTASPACEALIASEASVSNVDDLARYFRIRVADMLKSKGVKMAGWEEVALQKKDGEWVVDEAFQPYQPLTYIWNNLRGAEDLGYKIANAGYPTVLADVTHLYFDLAYDNDPRETGLYWGGYIDERKAFTFNPYDLYSSLPTDNAGNAYAADAFDDMVRLAATGRDNIEGIQGQLWSETVTTPNRWQYYLLPKLLGLAERAWSAQPDDSAKAYNAFVHTIGRYELPRLAQWGYDYRVPPPGGRIVNGQLEINTAYPKLSVHYSTASPEVSQTDAPYTGPAKIAGPVWIRAFDAAGKGSRVERVE